VERVFPFILVGEMVLASLPYWLQGDWRHGSYWLCAAAINFVVTI